MRLDARVDNGLRAALDDHGPEQRGLVTHDGNQLPSTIADFAYHQYALISSFFEEADHLPYRRRPNGGQCRGSCGRRGTGRPVAPRPREGGFSAPLSAELGVLRLRDRKRRPRLSLKSACQSGLVDEPSELPSVARLHS